MIIIKDHLDRAFYRGRTYLGQPVEPRGIIFHWSAGGQDAKSLQRFLNRVTSAESYNYGIGDTQVIEYVDPDNVAWATGDGKIPLSSVKPHAQIMPYPGRRKKRHTNAHTIAVCLCNRGPSKPTAPDAVIGTHRNPKVRGTCYQAYTAFQLDSVVQLTQELMQRYPSLEFAMGHEDTTNHVTKGKVGSKIDPGPAFPWMLISNLGLHVLRMNYVTGFWDVMQPA